MAKTIDISGKLTNERPVLKLSKDLELSVDNRKNTVLQLDQMEDTGPDKILALLLGEDGAAAVEALDLSFDDYLYVVIGATAAATGESLEVAEARFQKERSRV